MAQQEAYLRQAQELIAHQAGLQAAREAGEEIVISELGATISVDVGNRRPTSCPDGGPIMRGGRWM